MGEKKKLSTLSACLGKAICCMNFSLPKRVGHHFWAGLIIIPLAKNNTLPITLHYIVGDLLENLNMMISKEES
jgi:hypothetical protein